MASHVVTMVVANDYVIAIKGYVESSAPLHRFQLHCFKNGGIIAEKWQDQRLLWLFAKDYTVQPCYNEPWYSELPLITNMICFSQNFCRSLIFHPDHHTCHSHWSADCTKKHTCTYDRPVNWLAQSSNHPNISIKRSLINIHGNRTSKRAGNVLINTINAWSLNLNWIHHGRSAACRK